MDNSLKKQNGKLLILIFFMIFVTVFLYDGICQVDRLQPRREMERLEKIIRQESEQENHPVVEQAMDRIVAFMGELGDPEEEQSKRMQQRIQYSVQAKRFFSAYEAAISWLAHHPNDIAVTNQLGSAAIYMNRNREAREALRTVYESNPENALYQERYLYVLKVLKEREECAALCANILSHPNRPERLKLAVVNALIDIAKEQDALTAAESLEAFAGKETLMAFMNGMIAFKNGSFDDALAQFQIVEAKHPRYAQAQMQIAVCLSRLRRFEEAARHNLRILAVNPYHQNAYVNLAQALARLQKTKASGLVISIQKRLEQEDMPVKEGDYYWSKGDMVEYGRLHTIGLNSKYQFREAERLLETISQTVPESIQAKINLGRHYFTTLQAGKAEALFRSLMSQTVGDETHTIQIMLAEALLRQDKPDDVLWMPDSMEGKNKEALHALTGTYYLEMKQKPDRALPYLELIPDATYYIISAKGKCLTQLNQPTKALNLLNQIPDEEFTPEQTLTKAECMIQLGEIAKAEELIQETIQDHPEVSKLLLVPVQAALMKAKRDPLQSEWEEKAKEISRIRQEIQTKVTEAQRIGLPGSTPYFAELSDLFETVEDRRNALLYARRAYDAEPNNPQHLIRLIHLMTKEEDVIERYHLIQKAKRVDGIKDDMEDEMNDVLSVLEMN